MTILAAVYKNGEMWMMADQLTTWGDFSRSDNVNRSKVIPLPHALVGLTGLCVYNDALQFFFDKQPKQRKVRFESALDVTRFLSDFNKFLKDEYGLGGAQNNDIAYLGQCQLLIVTRTSIFSIGSDRCVLEFDNYGAAGSGKMIAMGALHTLYNRLESPPDILQEAFEATCHFITSCGGNMELINVNTTLGRGKKAARITKTASTQSKPPSKAKSRALSRSSKSTTLPQKSNAPAAKPKRAVAKAKPVSVKAKGTPAKNAAAKSTTKDRKPASAPAKASRPGRNRASASPSKKS